MALVRSSSRLCAAVLLAALALGAAQVQGELEDNPADCVEYTVSRTPYRSVSKAFYSQLRLGLSVRADSSWSVQLVISSPRADYSCTFTLSSKAVSKRRKNGETYEENFSEVSGSCSSWLLTNTTTTNNSAAAISSFSNNTWSPPPAPLTTPVSFLNLYGWSSMDLVLTKDDELMLMSTNLPDVERLVLPSTGFYGQLLAEWVSEERLLTVRYDCYSECTLRSGHEYHTSLGDQFYLWRSKGYDSLEYTAFPNTHKNIFQVVEGEPLLEGADNWVTVLTDPIHKTFNWSIPGSRLWRYLPWTAGHLHAYDDVLNNMVIHVPESCLVTNCHPYQLPCPDDPLHCQAAELDRGGGGFVARLLHSWEATLEWGVLIFMLLVIVVLVFVVCTLKRKLRKYDLDTGHDEPETPLNKKGGGRRPSAISKGKMNRFCRQSEFMDDFSSDHIYEDPTELNDVGANSYTNAPSKPGGAARGRKRDSELYCNMRK